MKRIKTLGLSLRQGTASALEMSKDCLPGKTREPEGLQQAGAYQDSSARDLKRAPELPKLSSTA